MMKRFFAGILAAMLLTAPAFAAGDVTLGEDDFDTPQTIDVTGNYAPQDTARIYRIDVSWGSMDFSYTPAEGDWDPATHEYIPREGSEDRWEWQTGANLITITNHSNDAVCVKTAFTPTDAAIKGEFQVDRYWNPTRSCIDLPTADAYREGDTDVAADGRTATVTFTITEGVVRESGKIGSVCITILE